MANTTNFGWETPDDTDLVKDGAAAMRTLGNAIDTSLVDLKGGTTGQILSKTSNTDMDFTWIANDQGDITGVTATSPLTGGGTSGAITVGIQDGDTTQKGAVQLEDSTSSTSTTKAATPNSVKSAYDLANGAIAKSLVDAKGDLLVGSADNTVARLAVGTNDYVLTADSSATNGIKWAAAAASGGMTLISETVASSLSSLSFSSLGSYKELLLIWDGIQTSDSSGFGLRFNNDSSSNRYCAANIVSGSNSFSNGTEVGVNQPFFAMGTTDTASPASDGRGWLIIDNYTSSSKFKQYWGTNTYKRQGTGDYFYQETNGSFQSQTAITSIDIYRTTGSGTFSNRTNTTIRLYGVQ
jgi:hypothetical protein